MKKVITRFAPSPTGYLHIGGLRTALFNYLWAKKNHGEFLLRIEDTDQKREVEGAAQKLTDTLRSFALVPDGETVIQSEQAKKGIYRTYAEKLVAKKKAYYCFCTEKRLSEVRALQNAKQLPPRYDGACRKFNAKKASELLSKKTPHVIRLALPAENRTIQAHDLIHGTLSFETSTLNDTVLLKSDGLPTYHLANVVDDHLMRITHVIRGEEWIPSLPLHVLLYEYFGFKLPEFCHVPLILNPDRTKLSKRQGDVTVESYLEKGYLKEAITNYIAFLGWNPDDDREIFSLDELVEAFDLKNLHTAGAVFNIDKLDWYNSWYIRNILAPKKPAELAETIAPFLPGLPREKQLGVFSLFFERIQCLSDLGLLSHFLWKMPDYKPSLLIFKKSTREATKKGLRLAQKLFSETKVEWTHINLELELKKETEEARLTFGDVFWPVRVALSGMDASPSPTEIAAFLGKEETLARIADAIQKL